MGLGQTSKGSTIPGTRESENDELIPEGQVTEFRSLTMRAAYLTPERPEIGFAVKELARGMAQPAVHHVLGLKRLARFLVSYPRAVQTFVWQGTPKVLKAYTDSDFAGCTRTRRSTSGYCALWGLHCLSVKCKHQSVIALSSGEA